MSASAAQKASGGQVLRYSRLDRVVMEWIVGTQIIAVHHRFCIAAYAKSALCLNPSPRHHAPFTCSRRTALRRPGGALGLHPEGRARARGGVGHQPADPASGGRTGCAPVRAAAARHAADTLGRRPHHAGTPLAAGRARGGRRDPAHPGCTPGPCGAGGHGQPCHQCDARPGAGPGRAAPAGEPVHRAGHPRRRRGRAADRPGRPGCDLQPEAAPGAAGAVEECTAAGSVWWPPGTRWHSARR